MNRPVMNELGYELEPARIRLGDFWDLVRTTARFVAYQSKRLLKKKDARGSVGHFVRSLVGGK